MRITSPNQTPTELQDNEVVSLLQPGMRVFIQGLASEPTRLRETLLDRSPTTQGVHWSGVLIPGINQFDYASTTSTDCFTGLFIGSEQASTADQGRSELLPFHYSRAYRHFAAQHFDLVILQVAPPDDAGNCSLGVNTDFAEAVVPGATMVLAYVNDRMPRTTGPSIAWSELDFTVTTSTELLSPTGVKTVDPTTHRIAEHVASLVCDGDCLQMGIGKVPAAVMPLLKHRSDLGMHSGLVSNDVLPLIESGVMTGERKSIDRGKIVTNAVYGSRNLYDIAGREIFQFRNVAYTHCANILATIDNLVSINSAIEVDLWGQVNSESMGGNQISGIGGSVDFTRGATLSPGGRSIIALASCTSTGRSRIVSRLAAHTPTTISRADVGIVVTEHGIADLRGLTTAARAKALIAIADPLARAELKRQRLT